MQHPDRRPADYADVDARWIVVPLALVVAVFVAFTVIVALSSAGPDPGIAVEPVTVHAA